MRGSKKGDFKKGFWDLRRAGSREGEGKGSGSRVWLEGDFLGMGDQWGKPREIEAREKLWWEKKMKNWRLVGEVKYGICLEWIFGGLV